MNEKPKPSAQPFTAALVQAIERGPKRPTIEKHLMMYLDMEVPEGLLAVLSAWARHEVKQLRIGAFTMDDQAIVRSFRLPVWVKDEPGPDADCYIDETQIRQDVVLLGTFRTERTTVSLGITRDRRSIKDAVIGIEGPVNYTYSSLEAFLRSCHGGAVKHGTPSALVLA
ncbi:MAG: hypothetical protein JNM40_08890 [Myxococcales bacterium]|nr:hypothetical protein [Myxococcales bacterium]